MVGRRLKGMNIWNIIALSLSIIMVILLATPKTMYALDEVKWIKFTNQNGDEVKGVKAGDTIIGQLVDKAKYIDENPVVIMALYDKDIMKEISKVQVNEIDEKGLILQIPEDITEEAFVKAMIWNSMEGMQPLEKSMVLSNQTQGSSNIFEDINFDDGVIPDFITTYDATMEIVDNITGSKALQVNYKVADFPTVKFTAKTPWDFSGNKALSFEVTNPTDETITFYLRVDDDLNADGVKHSTVSTINAAPNATEKVFLSFSAGTLDYGMKNLPPTDAGRQLGYGWGEKNLNASNIVEFQLWQMYNKKENSLIFDDFKLVPDPTSNIHSMDNLVDKYGQYTGMDWEGKIKSDQDLIDDKNKELQELENSTFMETSKYGGWLNGPKLDATGHFRVEKYEGEWTLVDPEGYLFFATGVDIVRLEDANTWITGRENMFEELPSKDGELGEHYSYTRNVAKPPLGLTEGWLFNHYSANLERKYGEDYLNEWKDISIKRFKDWGFSTLGNWSTPELFYGVGEETRMAYVANGWTHGEHATIPSGGAWAPVADPFDPEFINSVNKMVDEQILKYGVKDDPWCMGLYIDNETAWGNPANTQQKYALISNIFAMDASDEESYAKRAMIEFLKNKYGDITSLNQIWGTSFASFAELEAPYTPETITEAMVPDYSEMLTKLADKYFSIVDSVLNEKLPGVLYLGSRFAQWGTSLEVQQAAAKYVDVMSFNVYKEDVEGQDWMNLDKLDMPTIIGEFHFGSTDRGMFGGGLVSASDQKNRGEKYVHYMTTVAESPYFIGAHWFQYFDQPLLGRAWDGENYNIGFVDIADVPYKDLINSAKEIHEKIYDIKFNDYKVNPGSDEEVVETVFSFEDGEDLSIFAPYKEGKVEYVDNGVTHGEKAMLVNVGTLDTDYSGIQINPATPWDIGDNPKIAMDVTNPGEKQIQVRYNVVDVNGQMRTFYFVVPAGETKNIVIDQFKASEPNWGAESGYWGAKDDGLDARNIKMLEVYLWEDADWEGGSGDTFIIDNLSFSLVK